VIIVVATTSPAKVDAVRRAVERIGPLDLRDEEGLSTDRLRGGPHRFEVRR